MAKNTTNTDNGTAAAAGKPAVQKPKAQAARKGNSTTFKPGHEKVGGRVAGTPNKVTRDARTLLGETLLEHLERLPQYLAGIDDDAKRVDAIAKLLPFYMPKYQSTTLTADTSRSLTCEEEMVELDGRFRKKEVEISITEREIFNFDEEDGA